jgi:valyl-tRNA synthetase
MADFLIDVPPPTISGFLHMGHVYSYCHMDFIARYHRQVKKECLVYPFCFDNNGLPTEKLAQQAGITNQDEIIDFAVQQAGTYERLFQQIQMGWSPHRYHTFSPKAIKLAEMSFDDLVKKGYAYKAERDYFYCPVMKTSVSQNEIDEEGRYERSGVKVETRRGEGWFINVLDHLPRIRQAIDLICWRPEKYKERLLKWLDGLTSDWSISRERTFGISIPGEKPGIVFDTWHTSSLTPQLAWSSDVRHMDPTLHCPIFDVRFQAHDIIRTWALFTIIKSLYHSDQVPWKNIIISGHAVDAKGHKISKTAGNYVPPGDYIQKYGSSGVRYWTAQSTIGSDTKINEALFDYGRKFINKVVNAEKFLNTKDDWYINDDFEAQWAERHSAIQMAFDDYDWPEAMFQVAEFFWHVFCDVYIEESKKKPCNGTLKRIFKDIRPYLEVFLPEIGQHLRGIRPASGHQRGDLQ